MPVGDERLQYRVREPYNRPETALRLTEGLTTTPITLVARSPKLQVFLDGHQRTQTVGFRSEVVLSVADKPLRVLGYGGAD
jgi:hypothetical protein